MSRLVITQNVTLDGKLEPMDDWFSPAGAGEATADIEDRIREHMAGEAALFLGRTTFQEFRGYWPLQTDDTTGVTAHRHRAQVRAVVDRHRPAVGEHHHSQR